MLPLTLALGATLNRLEVGMGKSVSRVLEALFLGCVLFVALVLNPSLAKNPVPVKFKGKFKETLCVLIEVRFIMDLMVFSGHVLPKILPKRKAKNPALRHNKKLLKRLTSHLERKHEL